MIKDIILGIFLACVMLLVGLLFTSARAEAGTCSVDGQVIQNCETKLGPNGEQPNILVQWDMPTEREDNTALPLDQILKVRIYFKDESTGHWAHKSVYDGQTSLYIYKAPSLYTVRATAFDTGGRESQPTPDIAINVLDPVTLTAPKMPTIVITITVK